VVRRGCRDVRRLSFRDIYALPETFSIADLPEGKDFIMAANTGLWLMRFDPLLWRKFHGFQIENRMYYDSGRDQFTASFYSEDWLFSEWADAMGLKVFCTRKVGAYHLKPYLYANTHAWGTSDYDQEYATIPASGEEGHLGGSSRPTTSTPNGDPQSWCPPVWDALISEGVKTVLDVGCGCGFSTKYFEDAGCDALGVEADKTALKYFQASKLIEHDFTRGCAPLAQEFDLAWCCEVVEHVEDKYERFILDAFAHAKTVAMTHALPGQTGVHHVNCQDSSYWIDRMKGLGYDYDEPTSLKLRELVNHGSTLGKHFARSGMIFRRNANVV
jgi:SAM-dependent methyltransferase